MVTDAVRTAAENIVQPMLDAIIERRERYLAVATALQTAVPVAIVEFADGALSAALSHIQHPTVGPVTSPAGKPGAENETLAGKTTLEKRRGSSPCRPSATSSRRDCSDIENIVSVSSRIRLIRIPKGDREPSE